MNNQLKIINYFLASILVILLFVCVYIMLTFNNSTTDKVSKEIQYDKLFKKVEELKQEPYSYPHS